MKPSLIIIGLGNHGEQYKNTRHNAGFRAIDVLSEEFGVGDWKEKPKFFWLMMTMILLNQQRRSWKASPMR